MPSSGWSDGIPSSHLRLLLIQSVKFTFRPALHPAIPIIPDTSKVFAVHQTTSLPRLRQDLLTFMLTRVMAEGRWATELPLAKPGTLGASETNHTKHTQSCLLAEPSSPAV